MSAKIASAIHAVMQDVPYVQKTGKNEFHRYRYASEADLLDKLRPALIKHGLILIPSIRDVLPPDQHGNVTVLVNYVLLHKDGDMWPEKIVASGCGNDRSRDGKVGDKGLYKALTGANKYLLFKLFQIETGDDPEQDAVHEQQKPQRIEPQQLTQPMPPDLGYDPRACSTPLPKQPRPLPDAPAQAWAEAKATTMTAMQQYAQATAPPSKDIYIERAIGRMEEMESASELLGWAKNERKMVWPQYGIEPHDEDGQRLVAAYKERMAALTGETDGVK